MRGDSMDRISQRLKEIENDPPKFTYIPCPVTDRDYLPLFITQQEKEAQLIGEGIIEEMDEYET
jgi:hypothetical protein